MPARYRKIWKSSVRGKMVMAVIVKDFEENLNLNLNEEIS